MEINIHIEDHLTIKEIQKEFSSRFPFLKLEFFSKPHQHGKGSERKYMRAQDSVLKDLRRVHSEGHLHIEENMTVGELEDLFRDNFGLFVQVFRRSGRLWLETTATDNWTLKTQNEQGQELSLDYSE